MLRKLRNYLASAWLKSRLFRWIDGIISTHFRKKLTNHDFSILCSNCVGGIFYHRLGERFLSPTINLWLKQPDFVRFCLHLDHYLEQKLVFIDTEYEYPVGQLAGIDNTEKSVPPITIYFNHAKSAEEAEEKWETRKGRIRRDNLFIMLYNLDGVSIDELRQLESITCRGKVVFTAKPIPAISWSCYIKPNLRKQYPYSYLGKNFFGMRHIEQEFDFVKFFNSNDGAISEGN